ncbi:hypothetical protein [Streptosporangium jomthongense]|uniref:CBM-cenC domain-containing protein n=1 Tax=Streptosporangium jomthongense TaxID=1193683 RepID=A0ABV8FCQ3_9ACTN
MTRRNLCINPALTVDATGWGGGSTPTRVSVTGFPRAWAAEYTTSSFMSTAPTDTGAVTVGATYTVSIYARSNTFNVNSGNIYIEWVNGSGTGFGYPAAGWTAPFATVTRISVTAAAPAGAVACRVIVDGINFPISPGDFTAALIEESATLGDYFDGDSPSATWDGTPGGSSSTLVDAAVVTAVGTAGTIRVRPGSGAISTVQAASPTGSAGTIRVRASAGVVTAVSNVEVTGRAATIRLRPGAGAVYAGQAVALPGAAATIRARPSPGTVTAAAGVIVAGPAASIRLRAAQPTITTVQAQTLVGRAASIRIRAGLGRVSARTPSADDITIRLGPSRRRWAARSSHH